MNRIVLAVAVSALALAAPGHAAENPIVVQFKKGQFEDIKSGVVFAIENRGLVINTTAHVGEMLERTGKDLGAGRKVFVNADVLEFCSATLSRRMMEADPHSIVFCPYAIAVYELPGEPGKTYVSYRRPAAGGAAAKALKEVERLLADIVREALQ
ncbi:MAG: DUF302 domain-containing protein [Betaproteobacteria bacterium]|nr:DUF302 domain-containing protein [Betaproteobacteria bacterium]